MDSFVSFCEEQEKKNLPDKDVSKWEQIFETFSKTFKDSFELPNFPSVDKKKHILGYLVDLLQSDLWPSSVKTLCIRCLKIVTRTRTDLEPLFRTKHIEFLFGYIEGDYDDDTKIEVLSLMLNMCIIDQKLMMKKFGSPPTPVKLKGNENEMSELTTKVAKAQVSQKKTPKKEVEEEKTAPLYTQIADAVTSKTKSRKVNFFLLRILWHITIEPKFTHVIISKYDMFPFIFELILSESGYGTSDGLPVLINSDEESLARRGNISQALQILFNMIMDSSLPSASSKVSMEYFNKFADCCKEILSIGIKNEDTRPWLDEDNWETKMVEIQVPIKDDEGDESSTEEEEEEDDPGELLTATEFLTRQKKKRF